MRTYLKLSFLLFFLLTVHLNAFAESWDDVVTSGQYYYGIGSGATQEEADNMAWTEMLNSIVVHVSSDFKMITEVTSVNGKTDSRERVRDCMKTYSQGTFTNVGRMEQGKVPNITVLRYMKRSELGKIYEHRIEAARSWASLADRALGERKVDLALQYSYWAYSLVRSVQYPYEVKDEQGRALATELPRRIREILSRIDVKFASQDGEFVNLLFLYDGEPVSSLDFSYNDGQADNEGCRAQDGRGSLEMARGHQDKKVFHVNIEYENKSYVQGDAELTSVLEVVPKTFFKEASHLVPREHGQETAVEEIGRRADAPLAPSSSQQADDAVCQKAMERLVEAFRNRNYMAVNDLFDMEGLAVFNQVTGHYGTARLVGEQNITFFKGAGGTVTARGMKVSFSFTSPKKATFTEDLVFTFNKEGKICNVTFGLGREAEQDILCRNVNWGDDVKAQIMEFMENYKTAYCLKRLNYIRDIFADDAVIIVGRVTRKAGGSTNIGEHQVSQFGRDIITLNRYTKDSYLSHLQKCFDNPRNKYINVKFADNDIQSLKSFNGHKVFGIQIKQFYNSATYGDVGYLFLMVDMTDAEKPQIKVRTWQPNQTPMEELFHAGEFYR